MCPRGQSVRKGRMLTNKINQAAMLKERPFLEICIFLRRPFRVLRMTEKHPNQMQRLSMQKVEALRPLKLQVCLDSNLISKQLHRVLRCIDIVVRVLTSTYCDAVTPSIMGQNSNSGNGASSRTSNNATTATVSVDSASTAIFFSADQETVNTAGKQGCTQTIRTISGVLQIKMLCVLFY